MVYNYRGSQIHISAMHTQYMYVYRRGESIFSRSSIEVQLYDHSVTELQKIHLNMGQSGGQRFEDLSYPDILDYSKIEFCC